MEVFNINHHHQHQAISHHHRHRRHHHHHHGGFSGLEVEYRTRNRKVAGSTHTRSTATNLEQVANLLCAQANSASYPQRDGKLVAQAIVGYGVKA